jgi:hypothetical protein
MKTKPFIFFLFLASSFRALTQISVIAVAQYQYSVYHKGTPPTYYEGRYLGKSLISQGQDAYYEDKWSDVYTLTVSVFTGEYINELLNNNSYENNTILCLIKWDSGGVSFIKVNNYTYPNKLITEEGLGKIKLTGYDKKNNYWEIDIQ